MKISRGVLAAAAFTVAVFGIVYWLLPAIAPFYVARNAAPLTRITPRKLSDTEVSTSAGKTFSYFGYQFQGPWTDFDESKTQLYPKRNPTMVVLAFRSGLRLSFWVMPAKKATQGSDTAAPNPGRELTRSRYEFTKKLYEFTPDSIDRWDWAFSRGVRSQEMSLLITKSVLVCPCAESGMYNLQNTAMKGFQQGNPQAHAKLIKLELYGADDEVTFNIATDRPLEQLTQRDINRIVQSVRKLPTRSL